jgi:hypothetical protein
VPHSTGTGGLSSLSLQAPVVRSELGGRVTTLSTSCGRGKRSMLVPPRSGRRQQDSGRDDGLHIFHSALADRILRPLPCHARCPAPPDIASTNSCAACGTTCYHIVGTRCGSWCVVYRCGMTAKLGQLSRTIPTIPQTTYKEGVPC